jgi:hypothetical protein
MRRFALVVSSVLLFAVIIIVIDDHVRYARDVAFLADIDSTRGVFFKLDPNGHDRISVRYVVKGLVYTSQENGPKAARDYRGGDSVTVYFRRAQPSRARFIRPMAHRLSWWLILGLWTLGYVFLLGVGGSFARGMRDDVVPRSGAT